MSKDIIDRQPLVSVVVVNFNGLAFLRQCLSALMGQTYPSLEVIFVDNGSKDGSVEYVKRDFPSVTVIENDRNLGFARANNIGIMASKGDLIATLNNDTEAMPDWVGSLAKAMLSDPKTGMCASRMLFMKDRGMINSTGICISRSGACWDRGMFEPDAGQYDVSEEVFGPCAGAALYRRAMLDRIGLFDEDFFTYMEDADLAFRGRAAGWKCLYVPGAVVYHYGSATAGYMSDFSIYYGNRNIVWNAVKNFPGPLLWTSLPWVLGRSLAVIPYYWLRGHGRVALRAKIDSLKGAPRMISKRRPYDGHTADVTRFIRAWADIPAPRDQEGAGRTKPSGEPSKEVP
jgi:GT2 family glycosyltransferase